MIQKQEPLKLLNAVIGFASAKGVQLKKKNDLLIIFEIAFNFNKENFLDDLTFTAKYLCGLIRVLQKNAVNMPAQMLEKTKADYAGNIRKVISQLRSLISESEGSVKEIFEKNYFELTQEALHNLNDLLSDLEWTKIYLNVEKRKVKEN
jgi:hypothetical protein